MAPVSRFLLPPLLKSFNTRIATRGDLTMKWKLMRFNSVRIVSHRAQPLGEEMPDTAFRQVVVRIASTQKLTLKASGGGGTMGSDASRSLGPSGLRWVPGEATKRSAKKEQEARKIDYYDNGKEKEIVEYLVLQKRVIRGFEEDWKVWGFAKESTPEILAEDEEYWRKTLDSQAAQV